MNTVREHTWDDLCPTGAVRYYEGDDPEGFTAEMSELGIDVEAQPPDSYTAYGDGYYYLGEGTPPPKRLRTRSPRGCASGSAVEVGGGGEDGRALTRPGRRALRAVPGDIIPR